VSAPTALNERQTDGLEQILLHLHDFGLEPRTLGQSDYPTAFPLLEIFVIAKHCSGGVILGFEQMTVTAGVKKPGTSQESQILQPLAVPTPWNNLEAGILFGLGLPLLIFREPKISGGVFDPGVTDVFVHDMPAGSDSPGRRSGLREVVIKWQAKVREHYYAR
jgi:hypothetical protein